MLIWTLCEIKMNLFSVKYTIQRKENIIKIYLNAKNRDMSIYICCISNLAQWRYVNNRYRDSVHHLLRAVLTFKANNAKLFGGAEVHFRGGGTEAPLK